MEAYLCSGFSSKDWKRLEARLDHDEGAWAEAFRVFERRMKERFFSCIDALINADTKRDSQSSASCTSSLWRPDAHCVPGFSIMALCCLLIETMQAFREGPSDDTIGQFKKFLRRPAFGEAFAKDCIATSFVTGIRHGILHEAETRKWVIRREVPNAIVETQEDGHALNRTLFYEGIKQEFASYLKELNDVAGPCNHELREKFRKQMNDVCEKT